MTQHDESAAHKEIRRRALEDAAAALCEFCGGRSVSARCHEGDFRPVARVPVLDGGSWVHMATDGGWPAGGAFCEAPEIRALIASEDQS